MRYRKFQIEACLGLWITLEIDLLTMTPATAEEVNSSWSDSESMLRYAMNDPVRAIALRAAAFLMCQLVSDAFDGGQDFSVALEALGDCPGWPRNHGITIVDFTGPSVDQHFLQVLEESAR